MDRVTEFPVIKLICRIDDDQKNDNHVIDSALCRKFKRAELSLSRSKRLKQLPELS